MNENNLNNLIVDLQGYLENILIKYDMFLTNRQYRKKHFKNDDEYKTAQIEMSNNIEEIERRIDNILKIVFKNYFPDLQLIKYDSRFVSRKNGIYTIGRILVNNLNKNEKDKNIFANKFFKITNCYVLLTCFEELSEEDQKIINQSLQH